MLILIIQIIFIAVTISLLLLAIYRSLVTFGIYLWLLITAHFSLTQRLGWEGILSYVLAAPYHVVRPLIRASAWGQHWIMGPEEAFWMFTGLSLTVGYLYAVAVVVTIAGRRLLEDWKMSS